MQNFLDLNHFGVDVSPKDDTEIIQVLLYYSKEESEEFKKLCKAGIKEEFGIEAATKGNVSDFILNTLKDRYGKNKITKAEKENDGRAGGEPEDNIPPV